MRKLANQIIEKHRDNDSQKSELSHYGHRRAFLEKELLRLGEVFYLDVVAYAVMSNHYHVVLFIDQEAMKAADAKDIVTRWH